MTAGNIILDNGQIEKKIHRLAYQLYEYFLEEKELIIAGVNGNGHTLAKKVAATFNEISGIKTTIAEIHLDKMQPKSGRITFSPEVAVKDKAVVIVDDVLNTGKTMSYAVSVFIREESRVVKTLVLADRNHRSFPVAADYVGISLATTLQEHLDFNVSENGMTLYLN